MKSFKKLLTLYSLLLLFGASVSLSQKEAVGKLTESKEVPSSQRIATGSSINSKEKVEKEVKPSLVEAERQGCTYEYCGGSLPCCEGFYCGANFYCTQNCEGQPCDHPDLCCEGFTCNIQGKCEKYCVEAYEACGPFAPCCHSPPYQCDQGTCQECSFSFCDSHTYCCSGYYCDGDPGYCQACPTYCGHGESCCAGSYCNGYMCVSY